MSLFFVNVRNIQDPSFENFMLEKFCFRKTYFGEQNFQKKKVYRNVFIFLKKLFYILMEKKKLLSYKTGLWAKFSFGAFCLKVYKIALLPSIFVRFCKKVERELIYTCVFLIWVNLRMCIFQRELIHVGQE